MPVVPLSELLHRAREGGYAVGYFESWDVYSLEATLAAAEAEHSPAILGIGGLSANHAWLRRSGIDVYGAVAARLARGSNVPCAILFNEADSREEAELALGGDYNAVMMHTQGWPWDRLLADTAALVEGSHAAGVAVEGEVGALAEMGDGGEIQGGIAAMTSVDEAREFVDGTGVDCLAVAVGNVHFVTSGYRPVLDLDRLRSIAAAVEVPLVLHGGSGTSPDQLRDAVEAGITKVNFGTRLKHVYGSELRARLDDGPFDPNRSIGSREHDDVALAAGRALTGLVRELITVLGSSGKA